MSPRVPGSRKSLVGSTPWGKKSQGGCLTGKLGAQPCHHEHRLFSAGERTPRPFLQGRDQPALKSWSEPANFSQAQPALLLHEGGFDQPQAGLEQRQPDKTPLSPRHRLLCTRGRQRLADKVLRERRGAGGSRSAGGAVGGTQHCQAQPLRKKRPNPALRCWLILPRRADVGFSQQEAPCSQ